MKKFTSKRYTRSVVWLLAALICLVGLVGSPLVGSKLPYDLGWHKKLSPKSWETLKELERMGILKNAPRGSVNALLTYQRRSGKSLATILGEPVWSRRIGLKPDLFKATWYMSNPYNLLPEDLQAAIRNKKIPFRSRIHVWEWCRAKKVPKKWRKALYAALIETTPHNLWRASRGARPFTKNGQFLEPIVIDNGDGDMIIRDGHIATDPSVIPTNSNVLLLVRIKGEDRILKVKAADIGGAIKGYHVDLPIKVSPDAAKLPHTRLPKEHIRNRTVRILTPLS